MKYRRPADHFGRFLLMGSSEFKNKEAKNFPVEALFFWLFFWFSSGIFLIFGSGSLGRN